MGCSRQPNLKDLLKHLLQSDELAVASFISETLLKEVPITEENKMEKLDELKDLAIIDFAIDELNTFDRLLEDDFVAQDESAVFSSPLARENDLCAPKISFQYLLDITQNFHQSNQIGEGGFSQIFQGITHNQKIHVAVKKRLDEKDLTFEQKRKIIVGVVKGINHMHTRSKPIVHCNIKPGKILLDEYFNPKIADCDLLRYSTSGNDTVVGTALYMSREAQNGYVVTAKIDVWAYGIVLLEIITGLKPLDRDREDPDLVSHFQFELEEKEPEEFLEPQFTRDDLGTTLVEIVKGCLTENYCKRWNMEQVLQKLKCIF